MKLDYQVSTQELGFQVSAFVQNNGRNFSVPPHLSPSFSRKPPRAKTWIPRTLDEEAPESKLQSTPPRLIPPLRRIRPNRKNRSGS